MSRPMRRWTLGAALALCWSITGMGEDWPRWRGPRQDGTWNGPAIPSRWPPDGPPIAWKAPIGPGYSGIVVEGRYCLTMDRPGGTNKGSRPDGKERIVCFDRDDGRLLWEFAYPAHYGDLDYGNGPRANPTIDEGFVYTLGAVGHAHCLELATGRPRWSLDTVDALDAEIPTWGLSASPLVVGPDVILHVGARPIGSVIAVDKKTGDVHWKSLVDPAGYATPIVADSPTGPQLVVWTPTHVRGLEPSNGKLLWSIPYMVTYGVSIATPIAVDHLVFVSGYWEGSKAIRLGPGRSDARLAWQENRHLRGLMAPPLVRNGLCYSLDKQYGLTCFDLKTGVKKWDDGNRMTPKGRNPQATFVWIGDGDRVLALNSAGELVLARFASDGYHEHDRRTVMGETWANPAFAGDSIFARNDQEILRVRLTSVRP